MLSTGGEVKLALPWVLRKGGVKFACCLTSGSNSDALSEKNRPCGAGGSSRGGESQPMLSLEQDLPVLPEEQYSLPEAVGRLFDSTILSNLNDALRPGPLADAWCRLAEGNLLRTLAGVTVRQRKSGGQLRMQRLTAVRHCCGMVARRGQSRRSRAPDRRRAQTRSDVSLMMARLAAGYPLSRGDWGAHR